MDLVPSKRPRRSTLMASLLALASCCGCAAVGRYFRDRALDLTDVVDVKAGAGWGDLGLGAKLEALNYLGIGLGAGAHSPGVEWFGRRPLSIRTEFFHTGLIGGDGGIQAGPCIAFDPGASFTLLFMNFQDPGGGDAQSLQYFRIGGEVVLPLITFGAYFNPGELVDFLVGIAGLDPAHDDGVSKWFEPEESEETREEPERQETPSSEEPCCKAPPTP